MPKIRRKWLKWLLIGGGFAILVLLAMYGAFTLLIGWMFAFGEGAIGVPQDCPGVEISVSGEVRDPSGQPISGAFVAMRKSSSDPDGRLEMNFTTDKDGRFHTNGPISIFLCDNLYFDVSAGGEGLNLYRGGYERIHITYSLVDNYWENYFPPQPIPVRLIITLVEKLEVTDEPDISP
jgi:hypothetical protein